MNHILRLHTDGDGTVWCGQNGVRAVHSKMVPAEFIASRAFSDARVVRILGLCSNADLIVKAHNIQRRNIAMRPDRSVEVGSPLICPTRAMREDPVEVLQRMWQPDTSARLYASWHTVDSNVFNSYLLASSMGESRDKSTAIFRYHPLNRLFGFFRNSDLGFCMQMVSEILDPRWFAYADRPHRTTRLMRFLGLTPSNFKKLKRGSVDDWDALKKCHNGHRAAAVYACWSNDDIDDVDYDLPHNFLWRIYRSTGHDWEGALKASQAFVRFVCMHWSDKLRTSQRNLFDSSSFFATDAEIAAYSNYMSQSQVQG